MNAPGQLFPRGPAYLRCPQRNLGPEVRRCTLISQSWHMCSLLDLSRPCVVTALVGAFSCRHNASQNIFSNPYISIRKLLAAYLERHRKQEETLATMKQHSMRKRQPVMGSSTARFALYFGADDASEADPPNQAEVHQISDDSLGQDIGDPRQPSTLVYRQWLEKRRYVCLVQQRRHEEMIAALRAALRRRAEISKLETGEILDRRECLVCLSRVHREYEGAMICNPKCAR